MSDRERFERLAREQQEIREKEKASHADERKLLQDAFAYCSQTFNGQIPPLLGSELLVQMDTERATINISIAVPQEWSNSFDRPINLISVKASEHGYEYWSFGGFRTFYNRPFADLKEWLLAQLSCMTKTFIDQRLSENAQHNQRLRSRYGFRN